MVVLYYTTTISHPIIQIGEILRSDTRCDLAVAVHYPLFQPSKVTKISSCRQYMATHETTILDGVWINKNLTHWYLRESVPITLTPYEFLYPSLACENLVMLQSNILIPLSLFSILTVILYDAQTISMRLVQIDTRDLLPKDYVTNAFHQTMPSYKLDMIYKNYI
ncbi:hypothetical protein Ancab_004066 [Ancistrocladus abbreviatus]